MFGKRFIQKIEISFSGSIVRDIQSQVRVQENHEVEWCIVGRTREERSSNDDLMFRYLVL